MSLPEKLQEIVDDFSWASREEKVEMLIQYAESLSPLPEWLHDERDKMEPVPECMTPVFLFGEKDAKGGIHFHFDIPPQSPTVPSHPPYRDWQPSLPTDWTVRNPKRSWPFRGIFTPR